MILLCVRCIELNRYSLYDEDKNLEHKSLNNFERLKHKLKARIQKKRKVFEIFKRMNIINKQTKKILSS